MNEIVSIDGVIQPAADARVSALDLGLQLGLAVFETLLSDGERIFFVADHLRRMQDGARALDIAWPSACDPEAAIVAFARAARGRCAIRAMLTSGSTHGSTLVVTSREAPPPPAGGVELAISTFRVLAGDPVVAIKSTNRARNVLARAEAEAAGAWDALFPTQDGDFAEATVANLFAVVDGAVVTPGLDRGCLPGVVRGHVIRLATGAAGPGAVREARVGPAELAAASEVFLTNTTGGVVPVARVRGITGDLPGPSGPVTVDLARRFSALQDAAASPLALSS